MVRFQCGLALCLVLDASMVLPSLDRANVSSNVTRLGVLLQAP